MSEDIFDKNAWLRRIGHTGSCAPTLETLQALILEHSTAISYESIDVLLGRPPKLDLASLQQKLVAGGRGGYCFEQNLLFRAGLRSLGFNVTSLQARVVRGLAIDAPRPALHIVLRVDLPEGPFLADVGFGNLAPTAPLVLCPDIEQETPHETMRFVQMGEELTLQSKLGATWEHIYRVVSLPRVDAEYEICNWFTASHPDSPYRSNLIAARPGPDRTRITLFNARLTIRHVTGEADRRILRGVLEYYSVISETFGISLSREVVARALETVESRGFLGPPHPFFA
ncbi:arylamine N-acetyltransferase family protein [Labrys miyagiensis]|nr:arylamine N-acetyltransferase [Labrys miyagiensis]